MSGPSTGSARAAGRRRLFDRCVFIVLATLTLGLMLVGMTAATASMLKLPGWLWMPLDAVMALGLPVLLWVLTRPGPADQEGADDLSRL